MVVLTGPMFSLTAKNKFGKAIVYLTIKGQAVARMLLSPVQPRPPSVMNMRIKYKALGKVSKPFTSTSTLKADIILKTPAPAVWNGFWVGTAVKQFQKDNTDYDALLVDFQGCAQPAQWATEATALGLTAQTLTVEGHSADHPASYSESLALYSLAKACWYLEVLDAADVAYTDPAGWDIAAVTAFKGRVVD